MCRRMCMCMRACACVACPRFHLSSAPHSYLSMCSPPLPLHQTESSSRCMHACMQGNAAPMPPPSPSPIPRPSCSWHSLDPRSEQHACVFGRMGRSRGRGRISIGPPPSPVPRGGHTRHSSRSTGAGQTTVDNSPRRMMPCVRDTTPHPHATPHGGLDGPAAHSYKGGP